ncbi:type I-C CRISPR-associated endonuclease Cas1c [uncultured Mailhella sp.]|uniref:type I-C CRISPR-associated endonuclease Cas1c n=1 Tax=uncultured Mailhella sp. TaxID=1981031 RepID=UPI00262B5D71|nr:type I-C CRISPR-associated endonuclease Cas1c [uncultured Mailhella sp.]
MKRYLNTLFVTTQNTWLSKEGECVELRLEGELLGKIPLHTLQSIACFGHISCSQYLLEHCAKIGVTVTWFTEFGRFMAAMYGPTTGNILLRRAQYRISDSLQKSAELARFFTIGKIANCRTLLLRQARILENSAINQASETLRHCLERLKKEGELDVVRGIEGEAAHSYFSVFDCFIRREAHEEGLSFSVRSKRPPLNEVNCLLSFFYTLLTHDIRAALEGVGLDPAAGFLHRDRPGRPSLALDMMEEFRPYLADRLTVTLINRQQIRKSDFIRMETGAVILKEKSRKEVLAIWQERKREEIEHPFLHERMMVGQLFHIQAQLLARYIRGELDAYPPFSIR